MYVRMYLSMMYMNEPTHTRSSINFYMFSFWLFLNESIYIVAFFSCHSK